MRKIREKMLRLKITTWRNLTFGEKVLKIILGLVKWGLIITAVLAIAGAIFGLWFGVVLAFAVADAISGGLYNASRAYRPGDRYIWF